MKYFISIDDIILANWWKVREGDITYCRKDLSVGTPEEDEKAYIKINDAYLDEFGHGEDMDRVIELRKEIALLQCEFVIEDDNFLRNQIRRLDKELLDLLNREGGHDKDTILIHLEKWMGFRLDENKITARKFYKIVEEFGRVHA